MFIPAGTTTCPECQSSTGLYVGRLSCRCSRCGARGSVGPTPAVSKATRRTAIKAEQISAKETSGRLQPASGALDGRKGDVLVSRWKATLDLKSTVADSRKISQSEIEAHESKARKQGTQGFIEVVFNADKPNRRAFVLVPKDTFTDLMDYAQEGGR